MADGDRPTGQPKLDYAPVPVSTDQPRRNRFDIGALVIGIGFEAVAAVIVLVSRSWIAAVFALFGIVWLLFSVRILPSDD
jgi:hypothetical protein